MNPIFNWRRILFAFLISTIMLVPLKSGAKSIPFDKKEHFAAGALVAATSSYFTQTTNHPVLYSVLVGISAGVLKETYDSRPHGSGFDKNDLAATALGAMTGALIGYGVHIYMNRKSVGVYYTQEF